MKDFLSTIIRLVKDERSKIAETVTAGHNVNSFEDYQRLVGRSEGLQVVLNIIDELLTENDEL
jgi:hypothetical protein